MTAYSLIPTAEINTGIRAHVSEWPHAEVAS